MTAIPCSMALQPCSQPLLSAAARPRRERGMNAARLCHMVVGTPAHLGGQHLALLLATQHLRGTLLQQQRLKHAHILLQVREQASKGCGTQPWVLPCHAMPRHAQTAP